jgi:hypothetical protein
VPQFRGRFKGNLRRSQEPESRSQEAWGSGARSDEGTRFGLKSKQYPVISPQGTECQRSTVIGDRLLITKYLVASDCSPLVGRIT